MGQSWGQRATVWSNSRFVSAVVSARAQAKRGDDYERPTQCAGRRRRFMTARIRTVSAVTR